MGKGQGHPFLVHVTVPEIGVILKEDNPSLFGWKPPKVDLFLDYWPFSSVIRQL